MIDVIDYGGGNIGSVLRCLDRLEIPCRRANAKNPPSGKNPMLLPGVGAFGAVMERLQQGHMASQIQELVASGLPYLGICVGLQVLMASSEESPGIAGLALIPGHVVRFQAEKVPQIGWNAITPVCDPDAPSGYVYYVNSYYAVPGRSEMVLYQSDYNGLFCGAIQCKNITAFQFHPEKSGAFGQQLLKRWYDAL